MQREPTDERPPPARRGHGSHGHGHGGVIWLHCIWHCEYTVSCCVVCGCHHRRRGRRQGHAPTDGRTDGRTDSHFVPAVHVVCLWGPELTALHCVAFPAMLVDAVVVVGVVAPASSAFVMASSSSSSWRRHRRLGVVVAVVCVSPPSPSSSSSPSSSLGDTVFVGVAVTSAPPRRSPAYSSASASPSSESTSPDSVCPVCPVSLPLCRAAALPVQGVRSCEVVACACATVS